MRGPYKNGFRHTKHVRAERRFRERPWPIRTFLVFHGRGWSSKRTDRIVKEADRPSRPAESDRLIFRLVMESRAMDRRRFVPSNEALEGRAMMSVFGLGPNLTNTTKGVDATVAPLKELRIDRLPRYLLRVQNGRVIPKGVVQSLQNDLKSIESQLHAPPSEVLQAFNEQLRPALAGQSLSVETAAALNQRFGQVLEQSGATPAVVTKFKADMNALAKVDSAGINPSLVTANDYALLTQMAMGIGTPLPAPGAPKLTQASNTGAKRDHVTSNTQPTLTGMYTAGFLMQIVDNSNNAVLGQQIVPASGQYSVQFGNPLSLGNHTVHMRAVDANGGFSFPSPSITLGIIPPTTTAAKK